MGLSLWLLCIVLCQWRCRRWTHANTFPEDIATFSFRARNGRTVPREGNRGRLIARSIAEGEARETKYKQLVDVITPCVAGSQRYDVGISYAVNDWIRRDAVLEELNRGSARRDEHFFERRP